MKGSFHKVSNRNGFGLQARGENKKHTQFPLKCRKSVQIT